MKIVYCIPGTRHSGGMERVLANKANYLVAHGYQASIITTDQNGEKPFFDLDPRIDCYDLSIGYEENNGGSILNKLIRYPIKQLLHRQRLTKILNQIRPDITISMFGHEASFLPYIKDGSKKLLEVHFSKFKRLQYERSGLWALADKWRTHRDGRITRLYDRFVVLTNEDYGYWGKPQNALVIPNASSFPTIYSNYSNRKPVVLAVGRYTHQKNFEELIKIWYAMESKVKGWELHIVGQGENQRLLEKLIEKHKLTDSVKLIKPTNHIDKMYSEASILAMTSRYEGLPMVLIEGQSFALPIVSYACKCGPTDIVTDGEDGYLIKEGDTESFANKLADLICSESLRENMSKKAAMAALRYAEDEVMTKWTNLFSSVVSSL